MTLSPVPCIHRNPECIKIIHQFRLVSAQIDASFYWVPHRPPFYSSPSSVRVGSRPKDTHDGFDHSHSLLYRTNQVHHAERIRNAPGNHPSSGRNRYFTGTCVTVCTHATKESKRSFATTAPVKKHYSFRLFCVCVKTCVVLRVCVCCASSHKIFCYSILITGNSSID
jgi:hypothetical protein